MTTDDIDFDIREVLAQGHEEDVGSDEESMTVEPIAAADPFKLDSATVIYFNSGHV